MQTELELAFSDPQPVDWSFDEHTQTIGRQGIAQARAILEAATSMATAA